MTTLIAILVTLMIVGVVVAERFGDTSWIGWTPNCGGCALFLIAAFALAFLGAMKLGAWIW